VRNLEPSVREGRMFNFPAAFVGHRMALCVYGSGIGTKIPPDRAAALVASGQAIAFQPYGRSVMREWVEIRISRERLAEIADVLSDAMDYAREQGDKT
jgi:hypothetical protein